MLHIFLIERRSLYSPFESINIYGRCFENNKELVSLDGLEMANCTGVKSYVNFNYEVNDIEECSFLSSKA